MAEYTCFLFGQQNILLKNPVTGKVTGTEASFLLLDSVQLRLIKEIELYVNKIMSLMCEILDISRA